ncbi:hypothetical protein HXX76_013866 [Chlamydomonas incerta]|uniref:FAS1 domain-containing protein n=1 Tax=Chlamydomonas incerta TaxID=51695 RepID=A0A835SRH8_CHLIN|nr:hypothetical protein HXX76_013866 [Chlamydomonas incerta]|eukprot:KAG2425285.1 hypothetical protein HXX76_013866 [Chlamydomonas incerta]
MAAYGRGAGVAGREDLPVLLVAVLLAAAACSIAQAQQQPVYTSIYDVISNRSDLSTMKRLVDGLGLANQLTSGTFTAFLPDNNAWAQAFTAAGVTEAQMLTTYRDPATTLVNFHLVSRFTTIVNGSIYNNALKISDLAVNSTRSYDTEAGRADSDYGLALTRAGNDTDGAGGVQVMGRSGPPALIAANQSDIAAGLSYCNVISAVARFWFDTYFDIITKSSVTASSASFAGLVAAGGQQQWLKDTTLTGTLFAPDNAAIAKVQADLKLNFSTALSQQDAADLVRYHMTDVPFNRSAPVNPVATKLKDATLTWNGGQFLSVAGTLGRPSNNVRWVGFPRSASVVPLLDAALLPLPSTAWKLVVAKSAAAGASASSGFSSFIKAMEAQMVVRYQMDDTSKVVTVYAPTDAAFARLESYTGKPFASLASAIKDQIVSMHVTQGAAYTPSGLLTATPLDTMAGSRTLNVTRASNSAAGVQLSGGQTPRGAAAIVASDNVMYGRSIVHTLDQVLIPAGVVLPQGGGGAAGVASAPSGWALLLLVALAVCVQRWALAAA